MAAKQSSKSPERAVSLADAVVQVSNELDADVFLLNSEISRPLDEKIIEQCAARRKRTNVVLILVTEGGDPDAGYRIARAFQQNYAKFTCIVPGYCKSTGTLIVIGAHELAMSDSGELGPLDVQMVKKDELNERHSGLVVTTALQAMHEKAFSAFEHFFINIKRKSRNNITFKTATEIASDLVGGLFAPISSQFDPMHIGEALRATAIAMHYGDRLSLTSENISEDSLNVLISGYPTHGFVIDRGEAEALFNRVRHLTEAEAKMIDLLQGAATEPFHGSNALARFLSPETEEISNAEDETSPQGISIDANSSLEADEDAGTLTGGSPERASPSEDCREA